MGWHLLLQGIFLTHVSYIGRPHWPLSHLRSLYTQMDHSKEKPVSVTHTHTRIIYPYDVIIAYVFSWAKNFLTKILGSIISYISIQYLDKVRCYKNHLTASFSSSHLLHLGDRFELVLSSLNWYEINLQNKTESTLCLCFCKSLSRMKFDIFPSPRGSSLLLAITAV